MKVLNIRKTVKKEHKSRKRWRRRKLTRNNPLRNNSSAKEQLIFSEMSGNCFWNNYFGAFTWRNNYLNFWNMKRGVQQLRPTSQLQDHSHLKQDCNNDVQECIRDFNSINLDATGECNGMKSQNISSSFNEDNCSESSDDIEVSEEMIEFMQINMKHKAELEAEKERFRQLRSAMDVKEDSDRDNVEECRVPNNAVINECRKQEIMNLYGQAAAMIHGMETAIQLTFNWNCDHHKPEYWPILPFSFKFAR